MSNRYEAFLILRAQGSEDSTKEIIERLTGEFTAEGAKVEQVQRMDKRQFAYAAGDLSSGYYVNFIFEADPTIIDKLLAKFRLDEDVYRQHYQRLRTKKTGATAEA